MNCYLMEISIKKCRLNKGPILRTDTISRQYKIFNCSFKQFKTKQLPKTRKTITDKIGPHTVCNSVLNKENIITILVKEQNRNIS